MVKPLDKQSQENEFSVSLNYATVILLLVVFIPLTYIVITSLQPAAAPPDIKSTLKSTLIQQNNSSSPIESALKAVVDNPNFQSYLDLGLAYYNAAKYPESIRAWEKALEYNQQRDVVYNNIAAAYGAMNKWDEEIAACEKALALNPNMTVAKNNLAWAKKMKNQK